MARAVIFNKTEMRKLQINLYNNYTLCHFSMVRNRQFFRDGKASHSSCIWMSARHGVAAAENFGQRECCRSDKNWSKRKKVLEDDVFIENTRLVSCSRRRFWIYARRRSCKHIMWSTWPMVSRDWTLSVRHLCGNKWHTAQNNLLECKVL